MDGLKGSSQPLTSDMGGSDGAVLLCPPPIVALTGFHRTTGSGNTTASHVYFNFMISACVENIKLLVIRGGRRRLFGNTGITMRNNNFAERQQAGTSLALTYFDLQMSA